MSMPSSAVRLNTGGGVELALLGMLGWLLQQDLVTGIPTRAGGWRGVRGVVRQGISSYIWCMGDCRRVCGVVLLSIDGWCNSCQLTSVEHIVDSPMVGQLEFVCEGS